MSTEGKKVRRIGFAVFVLLLTAFMGETRAASPTIDGSKIIDLTYRFDSQTIYWPTEHPFLHEFEHYGLTPQGYFYSSAKFAAPEHGGHAHGCTNSFQEGWAHR
jgi:hypothetical protein